METQILTPSWKKTQHGEDAASPRVATGGFFFGGGRLAGGEVLIVSIFCLFWSRKNGPRAGLFSRAPSHRGSPLHAAISQTARLILFKSNLAILGVFASMRDLALPILVLSVWVTQSPSFISDRNLVKKKKDVF